MTLSYGSGAVCFVLTLATEGGCHCDSVLWLRGCVLCATWLVPVSRSLLLLLTCSLAQGLYSLFLAWSRTEYVVAAAALSLHSGVVCFVLMFVTEGDCFCHLGSI